MVASAPKRASYDDVRAAPEHVIAEVVDGELSLQPRPAKPHANAATVLGEELGPPFRRGRGGPGGWLLLDEPELHLGEDVLVPDLAGWRRERMPVLDASEPYFTLPPDWICEVLSPATMRFDRLRKMPVYARAAVAHAWLVDPMARTLEVFRREGTHWLWIGGYEGDAIVRAEPFEAFALELGALWADVAGG
jgi:Uma2 family endonuclease